MKRLFDIIVASEEGYTRRQRANGAMLVAGIVAMCIIAEIISVL
jgi:hypothetical protein